MWYVVELHIKVKWGCRRAFQWTSPTCVGPFLASLLNNFFSQRSFSHTCYNVPMLSKPVSCICILYMYLCLYMCSQWVVSLHAHLVFVISIAVSSIPTSLFSKHCPSLQSFSIIYISQYSIKFPQIFQWLINDLYSLGCNKAHMYASLLSLHCFW